MDAPSENRARDVDARGRRGFFAALGGLSLGWLGTLLYPIYRYLGPRPAPDPFGA